APELQVLLPVVVTDRFRYAVLLVASERMSLPVGQRAVVLHQTLERFPGEIEAVEGGIAALQRRHDAQSLGIVIEAAERTQAIVKRPLASVSERRGTEIVRERERLCGILVETGCARPRPRHLGGFQRVGEPRAGMG